MEIWLPIKSSWNEAIKLGEVIGRQGVCQIMADTFIVPGYLRTQPPN